MALVKRIIKTRQTTYTRCLPDQASTCSGPQLDPEGCSPTKSQGPPVAMPSTLGSQGFKCLFSEPQLPREKGY